MTNTEKQTEALRLADCLERDIRLEWMEIDHNTAAAAELRRLDTENKAMLKALEAVEMDVVEIGMGESTISDSARYKVEDVLQQVRAAQAAAKDGGAA
ncbi:hypothetical protein [Delftia tsuruhatensis]|jgi:hypothetical protein|uniref:hypothetical protein n=1 Tax=Delftia tsuruhatensis TaxID=180282 RepID=UPI003A8BA24F